MSEVKSGAVLAYTNVVISNIVALLYTPIVVRILGQGNYGVYKLCDSVVASLSLLSLGFGTAYVRFYARLKVARDDQGIANLNGLYIALFTAVSALACFGGWGLMAASPRLFDSTLSYEEIDLAKTLILIMTGNIVVTFLSSVFSSYILVHERFRWIYSVALLMKILGPLLGVGTLLAGWGAIGAAATVLCISLFSLLWNVVYSVKKLGMKFHLSISGSIHLGEIVVFSAWVFLTQIFNILTDNVPNFILAARAGSVDVAIFAIAFQIRQMFSTLSTALSGVFTPRINTLVANNKGNKSLLQLMIQVGRYQLVLHLMLFGGFLLVGKYFIQIWVGEGYELSYWIAVVLSFVVVVPLIQNIGIQIQQAKNMHKFRSIAYLLSAIGGVIISWLMVPSYGAIGATVGYCFIVVTSTWIAMNWYYHFRIKLDMKVYWQAMMPILGTGVTVTGAFAIVTYVFPVNSLLHFTVIGGLFSCLYALSIWHFALSLQEKQQLRELIYHIPFVGRRIHPDE